MASKAQNQYLSYKATPWENFETLVRFKHGTTERYAKLSADKERFPFIDRVTSITSVGLAAISLIGSMVYNYYKLGLLGCLLAGIIFLGRGFYVKKIHGGLESEKKVVKDIYEKMTEMVDNYGRMKIQIIARSFNMNMKCWVPDLDKGAQAQKILESLTAQYDNREKRAIDLCHDYDGIRDKHLELYKRASEYIERVIPTPSIEERVLQSRCRVLINKNFLSGEDELQVYIGFCKDQKRWIASEPKPTA